MATVKKLRATTFTTPSDREIVATRVIDAARRLVWEAWTSPKHVPHWLLGPEGWTMPVCEIDLRPGGGWHFVWRHADGNEMDMRGVYQEITPPERLVSVDRGGRQGDDDVHRPLRVAEEPRRRARNRDEGRLVRELRSSRQVPSKNGMRRYAAPPQDLFSQ